MKFLALPYLLVLFIVTFIDSCVQWLLPHGGRFPSATWGLNKWIMPVMSIGQIAKL